MLHSRPQGMASVVINAGVLLRFPWIPFTVSVLTLPRCASLSNSRACRSLPEDCLWAPEPASPKAQAVKSPKYLGVSISWGKLLASVQTDAGVWESSTAARTAQQGLPLQLPHGLRPVPPEMASCLAATLSFLYSLTCFFWEHFLNIMPKCLFKGLFLGNRV